MSEKALTPQDLIEQAEALREESRRGTVRAYANDSAAPNPAKPVRIQGRGWNGDKIDKVVRTAAALRALSRAMTIESDGDCLPVRIEYRKKNDRTYSNRVLDAKLAIATEPQALNLVLNERFLELLAAVLLGTNVIGLRPAEAPERGDGKPTDDDIEGWINGTSAKKSATPAEEAAAALDDADELDSDFSQ